MTGATQVQAWTNMTNHDKPLGASLCRNQPPTSWAQPKLSRHMLAPQGLKTITQEVGKTLQMGVFGMARTEPPSAGHQWNNWKRWVFLEGRHSSDVRFLDNICVNYTVMISNVYSKYLYVAMHLSHYMVWFGSQPLMECGIRGPYVCLFSCCVPESGRHFAVRGQPWFQSTTWSVGGLKSAVGRTSAGSCFFSPTFCLVKSLSCSCFLTTSPNTRNTLRLMGALVSGFAPPQNIHRNLSLLL